LVEYITSRIQIPPHPIYYKKDWNSTNTSHPLYYKTDSISTNRHILRHYKKDSTEIRLAFSWFLYMDFFTMVASQLRCFVSSQELGFVWSVKG
jgi:hypothetical protein